MPYIQTVTGEICPDALKFCQCHEHLVIDKGTSFLVNPALCIDDYPKSLQEVTDFALAGGTAIVDAQPVGCGRNAEMLSQISLNSGVHIISSTGFHKMIFYPEDHWVFRFDSTQLTKLFTHELCRGMYMGCDNALPSKYCDSKAGIIKCALDVCGLDTQYKKLFHAAAMAHRNTGAPLMVHIEQGANPLDLLRFLLSKQVNPEKLIFCHMDRACPDISLHKELCLQGVYLEYDTIGRFKYHDDFQEARIFREMIDCGYEDRLLFSLDTTRERMKSYHKDGVGLTYILNTFISILLKNGIPQEHIHKISCTNCRNVLTIGKENHL